jgi:hypothetical protein
MAPRLRTMLCSIMILSLFVPVAMAYEPGTSGLLFLRLGVGERAAGMGEAYTALAQDATALYWNPAGLASVQGTELHLMHHEWMLSLRQEFAGVAHATDLGTFAFGFTALNMSEMERREEVPTSEPLGHFSAFDLAFHLGYGRNVMDVLDVGLAVKYVYSRLDEESAKGVLVDLGLRHESMIPGLTMAAAVLSLGPRFKYIDEEFDAPTTIKLGGAYTLPVSAGEGKINLAYDLLLLSDSDTQTDDILAQSKALNARHHFGAEFDYRGQAALRAGYKAGYDSQSLTFGAGISWQHFIFDYAFLLVDNDLGNAHRLGVTVDL